MIYPTRAAVLIAAGAVPAALVAAAVAPQAWAVGPLWIVAVLSLVAADAALGGSRARLELEEPEGVAAFVGRPGALTLEARFGRGRAPASLEAALEADPRLGVETRRVRAPVVDRAAAVTVPFRPERRGVARLDALWTRWRGPLGLAWKQRRFALDGAAEVGADLKGVMEDAVRFVTRDALQGEKAQVDLGEGSEFHGLRDFQSGMDRRAVDWKQSARHAVLLARENRTERNHHIVVAVDSGRVMSEPTAQGAPRVDAAVRAALLLAYACLRSGDRIGLFAFDSRPRVSSPALAGPTALSTLQRLAARIDYSTEETNHTLGLTTLAGELKRRSLVVVFTEFADSTSAELMLEAMGRLLRRHLVLFVAPRDTELEALAADRPETPDDVSRAVVAARLLKERETVAARLRRLGAHVVDAPADRLGPAILNAYLELKRKELL